MKFDMEHLWDEEIKIYSYGLGHMTKMAAMPVYGKNHSKIFISGTVKPITLKHGV